MSEVVNRAYVPLEYSMFYFDLYVRSTTMHVHRYYSDPQWPMQTLPMLIRADIMEGNHHYFEIQGYNFILEGILKQQGVPRDWISGICTHVGLWGNTLSFSRASVVWRGRWSTRPQLE